MKKTFYSLIKKFIHLYFVFFYRHQVYGKENLPEGATIIAPNHASFLDPPLVGISFDEEVSFLARGSLFKHTLFKKIISSLNSYPINGSTNDLSSLKLVIQLLQNKKKIVIFPEGKRSQNGQFLPIKPGVSLLMSKCHCPIVPVYIHGSYHIWPSRQKFPKLFGKTACVFGKPIVWKDYQNLPKKKAHDKISEAIQKSLKMLQVWYLNGANGEPP